MITVMNNAVVNDLTILFWMECDRKIPTVERIPIETKRIL